MTPSIICRRAVLILAFLAPLVSFANAELFEVLVLVNAIGFAVLLVRGASMRTFAREMLVLCLPLAAFGLPQDVGRVVMPYFTRTNGFPVALSLLLVICSLRWFRAMTGCTGAVGLTILMAFMSPGASPHAYLQTAVIFCAHA
jgi:hypothetical protein